MTAKKRYRATGQRGAVELASWIEDQAVDAYLRRFPAVGTDTILVLDVERGKTSTHHVTVRLVSLAVIRTEGAHDEGDETRSLLLHEPE